MHVASGKFSVTLDGNFCKVKLILHLRAIQKVDHYSIIQHVIYLPFSVRKLPTFTWIDVSKSLLLSATLDMLISTSKYYTLLSLSVRLALFILLLWSPSTMTDIKIE